MSDSATWRSSPCCRRKRPHTRSCPSVLEREKQSLACSAVRMAAQKKETPYISHRRPARANDDVVQPRPAIPQNRMTRTMSRDRRRYAAARTEGQASAQIQVPPFQPAAVGVYPTTYHICVHFRPYVIACVLAHRLPLQTSKSLNGPPTDDLACACPHRDRGVAARTESPTNVVHR